MNETVKPTETPKPDFDYYDEEFKVRIVIEGDPQFKRNVTNLIETFKEVTPDDYADLIKYAPKKIVRSRDSFSWYQLGNDVIELPQSVEQLGGSNDLQTRKGGLPNLFVEYRNAMLHKTGKAFRTAGLDENDGNITGTIMNQVKAKYEYGTRIGLWTNETAEKGMEAYSKQIESGTFYDGAKLN